MPNPDRPCPHLTFAADVAVNRIEAETADGMPKAYSADITVRCDDCGERFRWIGLRAGLSPAHPMVSPDEYELRAPLRPASADPDFGLGLPGFAVTYRDRDAPERIAEAMASLALAYRATAIELTHKQRYDLLRAGAELAGVVAEDLDEWPAVR